jgi:hypothetical protein
VASSPDVESISNKIIKYCKTFVFYIVHNPTFFITIITIAYFALADRGFCVLFVLFILLKNSLLNFFKKSFQASTQKLSDMFSKPWNYWMYAIISLLIYLFVLGFKSLFYYLLSYKLLLLGLVLAVMVAIVFLMLSHRHIYFKIVASMFVLFCIMMLIPFTRSAIDRKITDQIKHVQFRASIIHQPLSALLMDNAYNSFNTQRIIETAENQWFINTYVTKPYDADKQLNLRAFSKVGVNYNTQTRDVVVARFIISEMGNCTMAMLLLLLTLPLIVYILSYKIKMDSAEKQTTSFYADSYAGLIPLLILFTIALFVWLTSTNRFVFFGQDFPFLSLTSRVSVMLPLLLYMITLMQKPKVYTAEKLNLQVGLSRIIALFVAIVIVAYATFKSNDLSNKNFSVVVEDTKQLIEGPFNQILSSVQDSLSQKKIKYNYVGLMNALKENEQFKDLKSNVVQDAYTKSILQALTDKPSSALVANSPLYIVYDKERYQALYNKNLYLELPAAENQKVWHGSITEASGADDQKTMLYYNQKAQLVSLPYCQFDNVSSIQLAIMPKRWFVQQQDNIGIVNVQNKLGAAANISICRNALSNTQQRANQFVQSVRTNDLVMVSNNANPFQISFSNQQIAFATNKWLNGKYKTFFQQKEKNFWMYHFANAMKNVYNTDSTLQQNVGITLDRQWMNTTYDLVQNAYKKFKSAHTKFTVIAADGDGNIRLMNEYVRNRKVIDPNDDQAIFSLQQKHFFFSNTQNERDQWANANLIHLQYGPGSSIKPLTAAAMASQVNAGWEKIQLRLAQNGGQQNYAGLKLAKPWEADGDSYDGQDMVGYIRKSSNYYQSILMFLGSYTKQDFADSMRKYDVRNVLSANAGANNTFPKMQIDGQQFSLPNFNAGKGNWPFSDKSGNLKSYFANENSVLANGLEINAGLATKDKDKNDLSVLSNARTNFTDSAIYASLNKNKSSSFIWSFPEESAFPQKNRHYISRKKKNEINENFSLGLKTPSLGGYPYQISPYKMLEMYNALLTQNNAYEMHILQKKNRYNPWIIDSSWTREQYHTFLANNVFKGMSEVIKNGTASKLAGVSALHPGYYFYAKTGTINERGSSNLNSRRLIVSITNKDLTLPENIGKDIKVFSFYFATDHTADFDWNVLSQIIHQSFSQASFNQYFN